MNNPIDTGIQSATRAAWFQFSLRELFGLTTYAACAVAAANSWGMGTLVASAGFLVAWMNYQGRFQGIQTGRGRWIAIGLGWSLFLLSMFLPTIRTFGTAYGWAVALFMIQAGYQEICNLPMAKSQDMAEFMIHITWLLLTDAANLCGALGLLTLRWSGTLRKCIGTTLHMCVPTVWLAMTLNVGGHFLAGLYVWLAGLTILASTYPIDRRTARWMLVTTSIYGLSLLIFYVTQKAG